MKKLLILLTLMAGLANGQTTGLIYSAVSGGLAVTGYGAGPSQDPITVLPANIIIPDTYQGTNVVEIGADAFYNGGGIYDGSALTNVVFGTNVVTIGEGAFTFTALTTFSGPNVVTIGVNAFAYTALTNAVFGASLDSIGSGAFVNTLLASVRFEGNKPTTVGEDIYTDSPDVTNYVHITSTGWDRTFGDRPVVGIEGAYPFPAIPIDTLVFASKLLTPSNMIVVPSASMSTNLWDSSVLWLTANAPIRNEGTTNAIWDCFARYCSGNAFQLDPNKQPLRVFTNGAWSLKFDGLDDVLYKQSTGIIRGTNSFTVIGTLTKPTDTLSRNVCGEWNNPATNRQWRIEFINNECGFQASQDGLITSASRVFIAASNIPSGMFTFKFTRSGTNGVWYINGAVVASSGSVITNIADFGSSLTIGAVGNLSVNSGFFDSTIQNIQIFSGVR